MAYEERLKKVGLTTQETIEILKEQMKNKFQEKGVKWTSRGHDFKLYKKKITSRREANNELSEVIDILLPVTFYFNPSTRLDNVKNL